MESLNAEWYSGDHLLRSPALGVTDEAIDLAQVTLGRVNNSFTYLLFHQIFIDHLLEVRPDMYLIVKTCHYLIGPVCVGLQ